MSLSRDDTTRSSNPYGNCNLHRSAFDGSDRPQWQPENLNVSCELRNSIPHHV
jgi:hypothetical protein